MRMPLYYRDYIFVIGNLFINAFYCKDTIVKPFMRYFIFSVSLIFSLTSYAVDHITCSVTNAGIPATAQPNQAYTNTYTCVNTYPAGFPAIQLKGSSLGDNAGTSVTGTCTTQPLASGGSCQFILNALFQKAGKVTFYLQVSVGSLYYLNQPSVTTTVNGQASAVITWPGFNSGFARATGGVGVGAYIANATDSSGHPITYTFAVIAGPGSINGSQNGSFSLTGVNNTTVVQVTARADDANPVVGTPIAVQVANIPSKILAFYNNSTETIYPIIEAPILIVDPWLQAQFSISAPNLATYQFQDTKIHRAYVNGTNGILPGESAIVEVPFYSELVFSPSGGNVADQYVDWWNAMRVFLYDVQANLITQYNNDSANLVTLYTPGPSCISGCTSVDVFSSATGLPLNDPYQLTEYTFADVVTSTTIPYPIDKTHVDYDYSGVDQIYLPVAMEPFGSSLVGYTGTTVDLSTFRTDINTFIGDTGWPLYSGLPFPRVPGAYNVVTGNPDLTNTAPATTLLTNTWQNCLTNPAAENHANCVLVNNLFQANYISCNGAGAPTQADLIQHSYGWAAFTGPAACGLNPLASTPGGVFTPAIEAYEALQYTFHPDYLGVFNPYTQLVHETLLMNVYAYSIDDGVGNINTIGDGVVMTIGGPTGLSNPLQYDKDKITTVNPGAPTPPPGPLPFFNKFGVCSNTASTGSIALSGSFSYQLPVSNYPCTVTLEDTNHNLYQFIMLQAAPFPTPPTSNYVSCVGVANPGWCAGVTIDFLNTGPHTTVGTPPPS